MVAEYQARPTEPPNHRRRPSICHVLSFGSNASKMLCFGENRVKKTNPKNISSQFEAANLSRLDPKYFIAPSKISKEKNLTFYLLKKKWIVWSQSLIAAESEHHKEKDRKMNKKNFCSTAFCSASFVPCLNRRDLSVCRERDSQKPFKRGGEFVRLLRAPSSTVPSLPRDGPAGQRDGAGTGFRLKGSFLSFQVS